MYTIAQTAYCSEKFILTSGCLLIVISGMARLQYFTPMT